MAFSQKNDIKKLIMSKIKPKKTQSQVNFTEYSQLCEYIWKVGRMRQLSIVVTSKKYGKRLKYKKNKNKRYSVESVEKLTMERGHPLVSNGERKSKRFKNLFLVIFLEVSKNFYSNNYNM